MPRLGGAAGLIMCHSQVSCRRQVSTLHGGMCREQRCSPSRRQPCTAGRCLAISPCVRRCENVLHCALLNRGNLGVLQLLLGQAPKVLPPSRLPGLVVEDAQVRTSRAAPARFKRGHPPECCTPASILLHPLYCPFTPQNLHAVCTGAHPT